MTHTNTQQKAPGACDSKGLRNHTNRADFATVGAIQQAHDGIDFVDVEEVTPELDPDAFATPMFSSLDDFETTTRSLLEEKL